MGFFTNRYKKICPDFEEVVPTESYLRLNPLRQDTKKTLKQLASHKITLTPTKLPRCHKYEAEFSLSSTTEHLMGYFYLQGLASQVVAHIVAPKKDSLVIDMAAAPGSKTTHIAQMMENTGKILAIDNNARRLDVIRDNCERLGVTNVICIKKDARYVTDLGVKADTILLDAPCSGNYCSEEDWENKRTIDDIKKNSRLQKDLLASAYKILKSGGTLVYSTCSLEPEEDEMIIDWALKKYPDLQLEEISIDIEQSPGLTTFEKKELDSSLKLAARFWPHKTGTEGFFVAKLRKA